MKKNKIYFKLTIALIALTFQLNAQMKIGNNVKSIDFLLKEV